MKKIVSCVLIFIALLAFTTSAYAVNENEITKMVSYTEENVIESMEVTEWYFRVNNGRVEKRLWSVTYRYWITDWIPA